MRKDTFWFSHDYNSRSDGKLLKLRMKHGMEGVGIYWCIVEMLYEENGFISLSDYERITFELRTNEEIVRSVINDFGLFEINCDKFWSNSAIERLKIRTDKSEQARSAINKRWEDERKRKSLIINDKNTVVLQPNNVSNTIKDNKEKDKIIKDNKEIPKKEDFLQYVKERCAMVGEDFKLHERGASDKYDAWVINGWKDGLGNKIGNWKGKIVSNLQYFKNKANGTSVKIQTGKEAILEIPKDLVYENKKL